MDDPLTPIAAGAAAAAAAPVSPAQTPRSSLQAATIRPTSTSFLSTPALIALQKKEPVMATSAPSGAGPRRASNGVAWNGVPIGAKPSAPGTETTATTQQQGPGRRGSAPHARETLFGSTQEEQLLFQHLEHLKQLQLGIALSHAAQNGAGDGASPASQVPGSTSAPPPPRTGPDATADAAGAPAGMANPDTYKKNLDRFAIKREQTLALTTKLDELRRAMHDVTATARVIHAKVSAPAVPGGQDATVGGGGKPPTATEGLAPGTATGTSTPAVFSRGATNLTVNTGPGPL